MKRLTLAVLVLFVGALATQAQTVTCSVSGATAKQAEQYTKFLAKVNADRARQNPPLPPLANFQAHCADTMLALFQAWVMQMNAEDAAKVSAATGLHGDETALPAHCTAAGLAAGCTKAQVACFILSGNTACN